MRPFPRPFIALLTVLVGAVPARALDAMQPFKGRIAPDGDVMLTDSAKIGRIQDKKFILQSDAIDSPDVQTTVTPNRIPRFVNVDGSGIPGLMVQGNGLIVRHLSVQPLDVSTFRIDRSSNYIGGQNGYENTALDVNNFIGPKARSFEDAVRFRLENSAEDNPDFPGGPQNVNVRTVTIKKGTSGTWGGAGETLDITQRDLPPGTAVSPTRPLIDNERVMGTNGPDANDQRVMLDLITARPGGTAPGTYAGDFGTVGVGIRMVRSAGDGANRFGTGISFGHRFAPTDFDRAIDTRYATFANGGPAINLATGQSIAYTTDASRTWNWTGGQMQYNVNGSAKFWLTDEGNIVSVGNSLRLAFGTTPASTTASCGGGTIQWDAAFLYVCTANDTWKRSPLATWTGAGVADGVWQTYTPTVTCGSGSLARASFSGRYTQVGKAITVNLQLDIAASGTCAGSFNISLPSAVRSTSIGMGRESTSGKALLASALIDASSATVTAYDGTFPGGTGTSVSVSLTYESRT